MFDWTTDQCEPDHIPDISVRAFRNAAGEVSLTIGHWSTYRMVGPSLDEVVSECTILSSSDYDPDPSQFDDSEWIGSPYTFDGETVYAVVHNEYRGDTHPDARPGQCPSGERFPCLDTSFTMHVSTDGGVTFDDIAPPPAHLIASLPYPYLDDTLPTGIRQPSNVIEGPDGFLYLFGGVSDHPDEQQWVCAMRTDDLSDPSSWRYWDGTAFAGVWKNPYTEPVDPDVDKCAPLAPAQLQGSINESIVFDERLGAYVMVGVADSPGAPGTGWGIYYSTSTDLVEWSARELLLEVPVDPSVADNRFDVFHAYPSLIDPDSPSLNFSTSDGELYLYISRFNGGAFSVDRDVLRFPIEVVPVEVPAPDWTFDTEDDLAAWVVDAADVTDVALVDGALSFTSTGDDASFISPALVMPAEYDRLRIEMTVAAGSATRGQVFFITEDDADYGESKSLVFDVIADGEPHAYVLDLGSVPGWDGTITRLRVDPVEVAGRAVAIDRISFVE